MDALSRLNRLPAEEAREELRRCCGASRWVEAMAGRRPFSDAAALYAAADEVWAGLGPSDWSEAFAHHPRIGDKEALRARFASTRQWAVMCSRPKLSRLNCRGVLQIPTRAPTDMC